jgi:hypothetical protein
MAQSVTIKLTANFERNLEDIERFLVEATHHAPTMACLTNFCRRSFPIWNDFPIWVGHFLPNLPAQSKLQTR